MWAKRTRILIVDDEPDLREIFLAWFHLAGFTDVHTAANGVDALALLQAQSIDVLVSDVRMPFMDGPTLVRRLAELVIQVPVIMFVSGFGDVDIREMYGLGVQAFIPKPLEPEHLIGRVEAAISDCDELWLHPIVPDPQQILEFRANKRWEPGGPNLFTLGLGGFSISNAEPMSLSRTSFVVQLPDGFVDGETEKIVSGHGHVR